LRLNILTAQFSFQRYFHVIIILAYLVQQVQAYSSDDCQVEADADILGLGVRLGLYFQLTSNIYIAFIHPKEAAGSLQVNNMFMTALFVSLLYSTIQNNLPSGAIICAIWIVVLDLPVTIPTIITAAVSSPSGIVLSFWTVSMTLLRFVAFIAYNTWFWFHGLDVQNKTPCQEPRVFFFADLSAFGGLRTYYKVNMVSNCLLGALIILNVLPFAFLRIAMEHRRNRWVYRFKSDKDNSLGAFIVGTSIVSVTFGLYGVVFYLLVGAQVLLMRTEVPIARRILGSILCGTVLLALFIIPMELQISWNKLQGLEGITSTGQLISLTVGSFSLIRAVFLTGVRDSEDEQDLESQGSRHSETAVTGLRTTPANDSIPTSREVAGRVEKRRTL
jgi:hypothetical protein